VAERAELEALEVWRDALRSPHAHLAVTLPAGQLEVHAPELCAVGPIVKPNLTRAKSSVRRR
jgi:hypothetical protein